eukprot:5826089-Pyramimonas_sp.AAC.1
MREERAPLGLDLGPHAPTRRKRVPPRWDMIQRNRVRLNSESEVVISKSCPSGLLGTHLGGGGRFGSSRGEEGWCTRAQLQTSQGRGQAHGQCLKH